MLCNFCLFVLLSIIACEIQANPVYYSYQNLPPSFGSPFVQNCRPYWASYYTAVPMVSRPPTPNVAYAFNLINTRNTCLTNDVRSPECGKGNATEQTTAPTTASCPSPSLQNYASASTRDPMHIAPMLLELFNPSVWNLMEKMYEANRPAPKNVQATTAGCGGGEDVLAVTTEPFDSMTESCTSTTNDEEGLSDGEQAPQTEVAEMTECVQIQTDSEQTTCVPTDDQPQAEPEQLTPESTDEQSQTTAAALPAINTEDIKTNLVEGA